MSCRDEKSALTDQPLCALLIEPIKTSFTLAKGLSLRSLIMPEGGTLARNQPSSRKQHNVYT